jgi:hypothetical protein
LAAEASIKYSLKACCEILQPGLPNLLMVARRRFIDGATVGNPLACLPLKIPRRGVIGLVLIYEIDKRKAGLSEQDKELFEVLANQIAGALFATRAYNDTLKKLRSMESFISLIKPV